MEEPRATVVIPVKDGATHLAGLLPRLRAQVLDGGLEVLAIDSGSRDGSVALLQEAGVRTLQIPAADFDHGGTRNLGAREARGSFVVFLSQDALPADEHMVRALVEALEKERRLAGAFARQKPRPDADPLTRRDLAAWIAARAEPRVVFVADPAAYDARPPLERYEMAVFDNVASAVPRDLLLAHPFRPTAFGEDVEWGQRMLRAGYGLAYVPEAVVVHSHTRSARALYHRNYVGHRLLFELFGLQTIPDRRHLWRATAGAILRDVQELVRARGALTQLLAAPAQSWAAVYGQYRGARDARRHGEPPRWARG